MSKAIRSNLQCSTKSPFILSNILCFNFVHYIYETVIQKPALNTKYVVHNSKTKVERYFIATKTMKIHYSKHEKYHTFHFHSFLLQMFPWMHKIERFAFEKLKLFSLLNEFDLGRNWKIGDNFYQHARINKFQILNLRKKFKRKWI